MDERIEEYALKVLKLARDTLTVKFRFFDKALNKIKLKADPGSNRYVFDGEYLYFDPLKLLNEYKEEANIAVRIYLHVILHGIFLHAYRYDKAKEEFWNIACDIAVENTILEMDLPEASLIRDDEERTIINRLKKWVPQISADKLYREFMVGGISNDSREKYTKIFSIDWHRPRVSYKEEPETILSEADWEKIAERVKAELDSFSAKGKNGTSISENLTEATKTRYDYEAILRRFAVEGEEIKINPDEFDNIFYTYGLKTYGKMPLIEPLEYTEEKKIREFVIVLDTSASCNGELVRHFLEKTYDILSKSGSFFCQVNIHIIEADAKVWEDIKINSLSEFKSMIHDFKLTGFGATDFRPAFNYVDNLIKTKELNSLKGLVYLTDGYGIYPEKGPDYDVIFAFINEDKNRAPVPHWAIKVILEEE